MARTVDVAIESGRTRSFASALDWPGWSRGARTPDDALDALEAYRERYARVLSTRGVAAPSGRLVVAEELRGDATTDFGAPSAIADADHRAMRAADRKRHATILRATWARFDEATASDRELRSGPRGGGRSLERIVAHVRGAEVAYARGLGLRVAGHDDTDARAVAALRARILALVTATGTADRVGKWPLRYGVRRIAWHVTDHLFELEDRAIDEP